VIDALRSEIGRTVPTNGSILDAVVKGHDSRPSGTSGSKATKQQKQEQVETASKLIKSI
jgi:hypothetical protein